LSTHSTTLSWPEAFGSIVIYIYTRFIAGVVAKPYTRVLLFIE